MFKIYYANELAIVMMVQYLDSIIARSKNEKDKDGIPSKHEIKLNKLIKKELDKMFTRNEQGK